MHVLITLECAILNFIIHYHPHFNYLDFTAFIIRNRFAFSLFRFLYAFNDDGRRILDNNFLPFSSIYKRIRAGVGVSGKSSRGQRDSGFSFWQAEKMFNVYFHVRVFTFLWWGEKKNWRKFQFSLFHRHGPRMTSVFLFFFYSTE